MGHARRRGRGRPGELCGSVGRGGSREFYGRLVEDDNLMPDAELRPEGYRFLQDYVYRESGIVLDGDKRYLLEARLMPIVQQMRLGTPERSLRHARRSRRQRGPEAAGRGGHDHE